MKYYMLENVCDSKFRNIFLHRLFSLNWTIVLTSLQLHPIFIFDAEEMM